MSEKLGRSRDHHRTRVYTEETVHNNINGKEVIVRNNFHGIAYDLQSRAASLSRRSLRRRSKDSRKYSKLEPVDAFEYRQYTSMKSKSSAPKKSAIMGDIFGTIKRGMASFSVPKIASKGTLSKGTRTVRGKNMEKEEEEEDLDNDGEPRLGAPRAGMLLSASSTDVRRVVFDVEGGDGAPVEGGQSRGKTPGITGIRNHGNTCYMNAVLQCLCHTDNLAKYFVLDQYKSDLSRRNKHNAKKYGTRGEVTEQLAVVFKSLWSSQYQPEISNQFKTVVGKYESQYRGSNQQDAQEFLLWLLDKVHEDLNTATKKKYKKIGSNVGRPDEVVAAEALANHMRCNNSFVHDLFQAQYRSSLTCPSCQKQSTTFDPFLCISTPIPQRQFRPVFVTVVYLNQQPKQVKIGLCVNTQATIQELRGAIATDAGIPETQIILTELHQDNFGRTFKDSENINTIQETDVIYAIEVPPPKQVNERTGEQVLLLWVNKLGVGTPAKRFGGPYSVQVHREANYLEMQKIVLKAMTNVLKPGAAEKEMDSFMRFRVVDGIPGKCYLPDDVEHPLYMETVDQALASSVANGRGPMHLKISVEWDLEIRDLFFQITEEIVEDHQTVREMHNQQNKLMKATLSDCFDLYTQEERLGLEDTWRCPSCNRPQQGMKKLSLWSVPDILVIHLKRFRQSNSQRTKLETLVEFPFQDLDMSPHIVHRNHINHFNSNGNGSLGWSPWRTTQRHLQRGDNTYDLYAICNHHGSMQSGHYTAFCRNPTDGIWYHFDDTTVKKVEESQITTPSAYILFYQRRSLSPGCSSSDSSSCSSDHWAYHMPNFQYSPPKVSKSHDNLCDLDYNSTRGSISKERSFLRGTRKYSSMVHLGLPHRRSSSNSQKQSSVAVPEYNGHSEGEQIDGKPSQGIVIPESSV